MNTNTHNQIADNSSLSTPPMPPPLRLVKHNPSYNPTTADFERLSQQYAQYLFYLLDQQRNYPRSPT